MDGQAGVRVEIFSLQNPIEENVLWNTKKQLLNANFMSITFKIVSPVGWIKENYLL